MLFADGSSAPHVATGVEFAKADRSGSRMKAYARKEVILAAGAIHVRSLLRSDSFVVHAHTDEILRRLQHYSSFLVSAIPSSSSRSASRRSWT